MFHIRPSLSRTSCRPSAFIQPRSQTRLASVSQGRSIGRPKVRDNPSNDRLQTTEDYPLSVALAKTIHPSLEPRKPRVKGSLSPAAGSAHVRTQIVSADLCDDVLKYIGHTLEKHKGCDVLDINPGAGLWSQKLHDFLRPRSHVLVEPRHDKFKDFLDPLLTAPDSKYLLVIKDPCEMETYRSLVREGAFPHQKLRGSQDAKAQELNTTLLVTGSLVWDPRLPGIGFDSMAKQLFHHFVSAASTNDLFHAFGLVRTLFWVQHDDFSPMITESVSGMHKGNRFLEMTHNMNVVVNGARTPRKTGRGSTGREPQYEIESTIRALQAGREKGLELPQHRRDLIHDIAEEMEKRSNGTGISRSGVIQDYLHELHVAGIQTPGLLMESFMANFDEEKRLQSEYPELNLGRRTVVPGTKVSQRPNYTDHPAKAEISEFYRKRANISAITRVKANIEAVADVGEEMYRLECKILKMGDSPKKAPLMKKLEDLEEKWHQGVASGRTNYISAPLAEIDDRLSMRTPPYARIQWDRRPFEPLIMSPAETWPRNRLSLISAEPIPRPPSQSPDWFEWVQDFVYGLYSDSAMSVGPALDKMQHGMSDIMKDCPALRDPEKGGRLLLQHLRVRMLTVEMIEELVSAYQAWPFKAPGSDHNKHFRHRGGMQ